MPSPRRRSGTHRLFVSTARSSPLRSLALLALLATFARGSESAPSEDRVPSLPGLQDPLPSALYSGFLRTKDDSVHYLLVESESNPARDPLVLWLNGGPGVSALIGFFQELGPAIIATNATLVRNPFSWSKVANVLFLESPTGVGFSQCKAMETGGNCSHSDTTTATLNAETLHRFLDAFPEYRGREFMIWGESYAGVYLPTLAEQLLSTSLDVKFLGFAVGDPCTSEKFQHLDGQLHFNLQFAVQRGFISSRLHDFILSTCVQRMGGIGHFIPDYTHVGCKRAWRTYYIASSDDGGYGAHVDLKGSAFVDLYATYNPSAYFYDLMLEEYLSTPAVRAALHVDHLPSDLANLADWGKHLTYTKEYFACFYDEDTSPSAHPRYNSSMIEIYQRLAGVLPRIVVFNGDTDPCLQFQGTEDTVAAFGLPIEEGGDWRPWFFKPTASPPALLLRKSPYWGRSLSHRPGPVQLAGYVTNYGSNVSFVTVHDAGHMVPMFQPEAALHMFERILAGAQLAPPLDESSLESATDEEFFGRTDEVGAMGKWIKLAQSSEFVEPLSLHRNVFRKVQLSRKEPVDTSCW